MPSVMSGSGSFGYRLLMHSNLDMSFSYVPNMYCIACWEIMKVYTLLLYINIYIYICVCMVAMYIICTRVYI